MPPASYSIRKLNESDDFEVLTELLHRAYRELSEAGLNYTASYQDSDTTRERCSKGTCFVAESQNALIGTILVKPSSPDEDCDTYRTLNTASIHQFGVDHAWRGAGIGKALHEAAAEEAREWGCESVALDTATSAESLIAMYLVWGYEIVEEVQWPGKTYRSHIMRLQFQN
jgi:GNAT superfamily N-acetyltransferase